MKFFVALIIFTLFNSSAMDAQIDITREAFFKATNEDGIKTFMTRASALSDEYMLYKAYKGAASAMSAGHASGVGEKLSRFNNGKKLLEEAVLKDWYNAEIRFLRFAIQSEVPFFLGYSGQLESDSQIIIDALEQKKINHTADFWKKAITFMLKSDDLKSHHRNTLTKFKTT